MNNKLKMTFGYENTDFTRNLTIANVADSLTSGIKNKIKAVNTSLAGGTAGGLDSFFRSDDYDSEAGIGKFSGITAAQLESTTVTVIPLVDSDDEEEDESNG